MPKFRGIFGDTFFNVEAENEQSAALLMRELLLQELNNTPADLLFVAWEDPEINPETLQTLNPKP